MHKSGLYTTVLAVSLFALLVLAACGPVPAVHTVIGNESRQGTVNDPIAPQIDVQHVQLGGSDVESATAPSSDATLVQETTDRNARLDQQVALFAIEPLISPCCPLPTPDKALAVAQNTPGVVAAELIDDTTVRVYFDSSQTDSIAIAAAINQASFLVTVTKASAQVRNDLEIAKRKESN